MRRRPSNELLLLFDFIEGMVAGAKRYPVIASAIDGAPSVISVLEPYNGLGDIMVDGVPPVGVRPLSVLRSMAGRAGPTRE